MKINSKKKGSGIKLWLGLLALTLTAIMACTPSKKSGNSASGDHDHHMQYYEIKLKRSTNPKLILKDFGMYDARNLGKASKSEEIYKFSFHVEDDRLAKFKDALDNHPGIASYSALNEAGESGASSGTGTKGGSVKIGE